MIMNNIWLKCHAIEWESNDESLPHSIDEMVIAPEWVDESNEDNYDMALSKAIDKCLKEEYHVKGHCVCFSTYDDKTCAKLDLQLLLGACHK